MREENLLLEAFGNCLPDTTVTNFWLFETVKTYFPKERFLLLYYILFVFFLQSVETFEQDVLQEQLEQ